MHELIKYRQVKKVKKIKQKLSTIILSTMLLTNLFAGMKAPLQVEAASYTGYSNLTASWKSFKGAEKLYSSKYDGYFSASETVTDSDFYGEIPRQSVSWRDGPNTLLGSKTITQYQSGSLPSREKPYNTTQLQNDANAQFSGKTISYNSGGYSGTLRPSGNASITTTSSNQTGRRSWATGSSTKYTTDINGGTSAFSSTITGTVWDSHYSKNVSGSISRKSVTWTGNREYEHLNGKTGNETWRITPFYFVAFPSNLNLRSSPGGSLVGTISSGTQLRYAGETSGRWVKLFYGSGTAWASSGDGPVPNYEADKYSVGTNRVYRHRVGSSYQTVSWAKPTASGSTMYVGGSSFSLSKTGRLLVSGDYSNTDIHAATVKNINAVRVSHFGIPSFAYHASNSSTYRSYITDYATVYWSNAPRATNTTAYSGWSDVSWELKSGAPNLADGGYITSGGNATWVGRVADGSLPSLLDSRWMQTYNAWFSTLNTIDSAGDNIYSSMAWTSFNDNTYRKQVSTLTSKTYRKEYTASYSGYINLPDIQRDSFSLSQRFTGTVYRYGVNSYYGEPTYSGYAYQRIKGAISSSKLTKFDNLMIHDIQSYDSGITGVKAELILNGSVVRTLDSTSKNSVSGPHTKFNPITINLDENFKDGNYTVRLTTMRGSTRVKAMNMYFQLNTSFSVSQPSLDSTVSVGGTYTASATGPRHTKDMDFTFTFDVKVGAKTYSKGTKVPATISGSSTKTGRVTFSVPSQTTPAGTHSVTVLGTSTPDNYTDTKSRNVQFINLDFGGLQLRQRYLGSNIVNNTVYTGPLGSPAEVKTGYKNTLRVYHSNASVIEVEFYYGSNPVNNVKFSTNHGDLVRYSGTLTTSTSQTLYSGDRTSDHKATVVAANPSAGYVDIGFILAQSPTHSDFNRVYSVKVTVYNQYDQVINTTHGRNFIKVIGSRLKDTKDNNNNR